MTWHAVSCTESSHLQARVHQKCTKTSVSRSQDIRHLRGRDNLPVKGRYLQCCCSENGRIATGGTVACNPPPNPCRISLKIVRRFSRIVFTHAKRPICGK